MAKASQGVRTVNARSIGRLRNAVFATGLAGSLPADVITVTPHTVFKRVHPACAVLKDAPLCEVVDDGTLQGIGPACWL